MRASSYSSWISFSFKSMLLALFLFFYIATVEVQVVVEGHIHNTCVTKELPISLLEYDINTKEYLELITYDFNDIIVQTKILPSIAEMNEEIEEDGANNTNSIENPFTRNRRRKLLLEAYHYNNQASSSDSDAKTKPATTSSESCCTSDKKEEGA